MIIGCSYKWFGKGRERWNKVSVQNGQKYRRMDVKELF
jgi:hypothetical protein